jgi:hypothetical protein
MQPEVLQVDVSKKPAEQAEEDLFQLFDPEGIAFWNFLKQHKDRIINIVNAGHPETLLGQYAAQEGTTQADTLLGQHEARVEKTQAEENKELKRLRLFVKDYFAEFFLASMSLSGMVLAVIYMLAHTWR